MQKNRITIIAVFAFLVLMGIVGAYIYFGSNVTGLDVSEPNINSSQAVEIVKADQNVSEYFTIHFKIEDRRVTTTSLIESVSNSSYPDEDVWKIEIMERSCSCPGIQDLYVVEGYVGANSGELLEVSTKSVLESEYDKNTCSSTSCH